jgi:2,5-dihydroxypyridine 5,6-dioxygenase
MSDFDAEYALFLDELELCGVREGEVVAVVSQGETLYERASAVLKAAEQLGAAAVHVRLPEPSADRALSTAAAGATLGVTRLDDNPAAIEALKRADLVVDLVFLLFSKEQFAIREAGARMLSCIEPAETLQRLRPTRDLRRRCEVAVELVEQAETMRITNAAGTDLVYRLGTYPVFTTYGFTDTPGRWDHYPGGLVYTGGSDEGVDGRLVIDTGDIVFPFKAYVTEPIELTIAAGRIEDIRGGLQADLMRDYMEGFNDPRAYGISHIGWGLNEKARWSSLAIDQAGMGMESRLFYGNVLFSSGPNQELGGTNDTDCHLDIPMRRCSVFLDDRPVVVDGDIVIDDMRADQVVQA